MISQKSIAYLNTFIDEETFVIGTEISLDLRNIFDSLKVNFINIWPSSYKLMDDICLMLNTNNFDIFNKLQTYQVPLQQLHLYANYWKVFIRERRLFDDTFLQDNSVLFIGQTLQDQSIKKGDVYLNILHFKDKMEELSKHYSRIYYVPHPANQHNKEIESYISSVGFIEKIPNIPSYYLLTSDKIKKVVGISSSVLYEAQFFNKSIEYLHKPFLDIDSGFDMNSFVNIHNDYFNPYFWSDVLSPIIDTDKNAINKVLLTKSNAIRDIRDIYYAYAHLDPLRKLSSRMDGVQHFRFPKKLINFLCLFVFKEKNKIRLRQKYSM